MDSAINQPFDFLTLPYSKSFSGQGDNNDSVVAWGNKVALTAKASNEVVIFDRETTQQIGFFPVSGPNSIRQYDDQLFVTTKEGNRKIEVYDANTYNFLFDFAGEPELKDGEHDLTIWYRPTDGRRIVFATDDSGKVFSYDVDNGGGVVYEIDTEIYKGIEEIQVIHRPNSSFDWLVVADENQDHGYVFRAFKLHHTGMIEPEAFYGPAVCEADSEGLSHIAAPDGITGYLFSTDQQEPDTVFHCWYYDDSGFNLLGSFKIQGVGGS